MRGSLLFVLFLFLCGSYASAQNIFRTACRGDLVRLDSLLTEKSINVRDGRGRSLLHWAIGCDKPEVFEYLIENGIDINLADQSDKTPLFVAVLMNQVAQFDSLVKLQADTSWIAEHGITLLERAILNKSEIFVRKLIAEGVPVNASNERGSTPLEIAKRIKAEEIYELLLSMGADASKIRKISMAGPYMGETIPGLNRRLFAPNFISTEESEFGSIFNAAGTEFFYGVVVNGKNEIRFTRKEEHQWTVPEIILSHPSYGYNDPFLSPAEDRLYSISNRALDGKGEPKDIDIWYVERTDLGWSEPVNAGPKINTSGDEYYISFTADGTMYFQLWEAVVVAKKMS